MSFSSKIKPRNIVAFAPFDMGGGGHVTANHAGNLPSSVGPKASGEAALGNKRENVDAFDGQAKKLRRERWADQRQAAKIFFYQSQEKSVHLKDFKNRGVTLCGWTQIANKGGSRLMLIDPDQGEKRAFWAGLQKCGLGWACPVCTHAKAEENRISLNLGLAGARRHKLTPVMMTLTARHSKDVALSDFWEALSTAEKELKKSRPWKRLNGGATKKRGPGAMHKGGFAKAIEVTHSERAGWHPHAHIVCLIDLPEKQAISALEVLRDEWLHQLDRVGLDGTSAAARKHAFQVQGAAAAGNYLSKWGAAEEMTGAAKKEGKLKGRTTWQLLRESRTGETDQKKARAASLWFEAIQTFAGYHQLRMSPAFKRMVAEERDRQEVEEKEEEEAIEVWACGLAKHDPAWEGMRWKRLRAIEAAENAGADGAKAAVLAVVASDWLDEDDLDDIPDMDLIDDDDGPPPPLKRPGISPPVPPPLTLGHVTEAAEKRRLEAARIAALDFALSEMEGLDEWQ